MSGSGRSCTTEIAKPRSRHAWTRLSSRILTPRGVMFNRAPARPPDNQTLSTRRSPPISPTTPSKAVCESRHRSGDPPLSPLRWGSPPRPCKAAYSRPTSTSRTPIKGNPRPWCPGVTKTTTTVSETHYGLNASLETNTWNTLIIENCTRIIEKRAWIF